MARSGVLSSMCRSCRQSYLTQSRRPISISAQNQEQSRLSDRLGIKVNDETPAKEPDALDSFNEILRGSQGATSDLDSPKLRSVFKSDLFQNDLRSIAQSANAEAATRPGSRIAADEPYHLNVYAHKHNTHITFTEPSRNPIISYSCGNLGLRKAHRSSYDAAFQLAAYTFRKMAEKQWRIGGKKMSRNPTRTLADIRKPGYSGAAGAGIEVVLRGYGPGREAFQKALLGTEGRMIKPLIGKVSDGTRLKFGGTRSPQVRRLG